MVNLPILMRRMRGNHSPAFSPTTLNNLSAWFRSDRGVFTDSVVDFAGGGTDEFLSNTSPTGVSFADEDFSMSGWYYQDAAGNAGLWGMGNIGTSTQTGQEYALRIASGDLTFVVSNGVTSQVSSVTAPSDGAWHFVYCEHDSVNNQIRLQVDNGTVNSEAYSAGCADQSSTFGIGRNWNVRLDGKICGVGVYGNVLTTAKKNTLYNSGTPTIWTDIVGTDVGNDALAFWSLGEKVGSTFADQVGSNTMTESSVGGTAIANANGAHSSPAYNLAAVHRWEDQSGNDVHLLQATPADKPVYVASGINSLPVIAFDDTDLTSTATIDMEAQMTSYLTMKCTTATMSQEVLFFHGNVSGTPHYYTELRRDTPYNGIYNRSRTPTLGPTDAYMTSDVESSLESGTPYVITSLFDTSGDQQLRVNGVSQSTNGSSVEGVGSREVRAGGANSQVQISEIVYQSTLAPSTELVDTEGYMSSRYGISL